VRVLVTSSRMPFGLGMIRQLAAAGHEVHAADDYALSPGNHSRYLAGHHVYASPSAETERFIDDLERILREAEIDVIVPAFEEAFYISTQRDRLSETATVFTAPFASLARLHDKVSFQRLVSELRLPIAETVVATGDAELAGAIGRFERYFARPAFSRGGVSLLTNTGPLAGETQIEDCHPTPQSPWLVQPFVDGETVCTYSTVHSGWVSSHLMYRIPRQWHHSTGIQFESIEATESLRMIEPIVDRLGYSGQISFDFIITDDGLEFVECNPRATDGLLLLPENELARGILDSEADTFLMPPGHSVALDLAVLADGFSDRLRRLPATIRDLARVHDAGDGWHDPLPTLCSALAVAHFADDSLKQHEKLFVAMAGDMNWDGEPISGMSDADARLLHELETAR
jgi:glutathione synthase/RimK-type ligase-like ATP-grasp enzyme